MNAVPILLCLFCCGYGLMLIFAKDTAWGLVEWRNRNRGVLSERTSQWEASTTFQGVFIIAWGIALLFLMPHPRNRASLPDNSQATISVDGRPATPEEQRALPPIVNGSRR